MRRTPILALGGMRFKVILASVACVAVAAACADDGDDPGVLPVVTQPEAGSEPVDAALVNPEAATPEADADPPPGDTCGDRAGLQANAPWPMGGSCPTRSGVSTLTGPKSSVSKSLFELQGGESAPVSGNDGFLWLGTKDGIVYAISPNGAVPHARRVGGGEITSTPAIAADGNVVVGGPDGVLYALNAGTPTNDAGGFVAGAMLAALAWSVDLGSPIKSSPAIGPDGTIYVGTLDGKLVAVSSKHEVKWRANTGDTFGSSPAIARDGTIYVASTDHALHAITTDGNSKWSTSLDAEIHGSPAIGGDGTIYAGTVDGKLSAVTPSGAVKWTYSAGGAIVGTPTVYAGGVYVASEDKRLHGVNVTDGSSRWTYNTLGTPRSAMVTQDGYIYFGSTDGRIYVLTPKGGLFFAVVAKGIVTSGPAISAQGYAFWATDKGLTIVGQP